MAKMSKLYIFIYFLVNIIYLQSRVIYQGKVLSIFSPTVILQIKAVLVHFIQAEKIKKI